MTVFEGLTLVVALVALGISWRAHLLSKRANQIQADAHHLQQSDINAKREPRLQISNETFLSTWQRIPSEPFCLPQELDLYYSSILTNKGESVAKLDSVMIELGVADSPLGEPRPGFGVAVASPLYLAAGETLALNTIVTAQHLEFVRLFCQLQNGVVVCTLVFRYSGYAGEKRIRRTEIYRLNEVGGIISKAGYEAATTVPRSYPVTPTEPA
jgi:hypothetical protein